MKMRVQLNLKRYLLKNIESCSRVNIWNALDWFEFFTSKGASGFAFKLFIYNKPTGSFLVPKSIFWYQSSLINTSQLNSIIEKVLHWLGGKNYEVYVNDNSLQKQHYSQLDNRHRLTDKALESTLVYKIKCFTI